MATFKVVDTKGIRVGTWKKEQLAIEAGETIQVSSSGQMSYNSKMLNLTADQFNAMVQHGRLVMAE